MDQLRDIGKYEVLQYEQFLNLWEQTSMKTRSVDPSDVVMCHCSGTRRSNIQSLFEQGFDIKAISYWTGALSGCGGCEWDIADFLKGMEKQQNRSE